MSALITLAMKSYSSWGDRLFSEDTIEDLLMLGMFVSTFLAPLLARCRPSDAPYFSGSFALALCPFLFTALIMLLRVHSLIEHEDISVPSYVIERLRSARQYVVFGGMASLFSVAIYSAVHAANRRTQRRHLARLVPNDRNA